MYLIYSEFPNSSLSHFIIMFLLCICVLVVCLLSKVCFACGSLYGLSVSVWLQHVPDPVKGARGGKQPWGQSSECVQGHGEGVPRSLTLLGATTTSLFICSCNLLPLGPAANGELPVPPPHHQTTSQRAAPLSLALRPRTASLPRVHFLPPSSWPPHPPHTLRPDVIVTLL